jgi:uncharacterized damage-inducible protein DinB
MLAIFEGRYQELTDVLATIDDERWNAVAQFFYGGKVIAEQPVGQFLWYIHFDAIHHRGQLSAYIRPMGGKVPSVYGPSADTRSA